MSLFRKQPPFEEIQSVLTLLGLFNVKTFTKDDINMEHSEDAVACIYGYYKPCKAKQFLDVIDPIGWITVLRHCLAPYGFSILRQETTRQRKKTIVYTLEKEEKFENVTIDFR